MIELQSIKKIYKSGRRAECRALDGVSFSLPDRGMVFVLGKSGSGKSTLLNILGGLDNATEGEVWIDGNQFSALTPTEQEHYRNLCVGFIFQDFCLIDGLTVTDNVRLSLDLLGEADDERVAKLIDEVGLSAEKDRLPRKLSGGQCQRVAIARALAKSPRVLLADEPTGNLDSKTAKQILSILKELSRDRLVVVVSHNVGDAEEYADRIIELADGKIVRDVERNADANAPLIVEKTITLPRGKTLSEEDLVAINEKITEQGVQITQSGEPFEPTKPLPPATHRQIGKPKSMRPAASRRLTKLFSKGGYVGTAITALLLAVLTLLLCFAQAFALFDGAPLIHEALEQTDDKSFSLHKGYYDDPVNPTLQTDKTVRVTEEDVAAFYEAGYEGKTYLLYANAIRFKKFGTSENSLSHGLTGTPALENDSPYAMNGVGILDTEEVFLTKIYGKDGNISLLAGSLEEESKNSGVYISDYAADCMLHYNDFDVLPGESPYQALLGQWNAMRVTVSGVFETGYRERYAELLSQYNSLGELNEEERATALKELYYSQNFADFSKEVEKYLAIGYFLGEDYSSLAPRILCWEDVFKETDVYSSTGDLIASDVSWGYYMDQNLAKGEVVVGSQIFNRMFGTNYTYRNQEGFTPVEVTLIGYPNEQGNKGEPLYQCTVTIVGLHRKDHLGFFFSTEDYRFLNGYDVYPFAIYFDNADSAAAVYEVGEERGFYSNNEFFKAVNTVKEIVEIFREMFVYIALGVALVALILIVSFALRTLRRKMREIGILRALGANTGQITLCFVWQMVALWLVVLLLSFAAFGVLLNEANALLVDGMAQFLETPAIASLTVLSATPLSLLATIAVFLPVLLLSLCVPLLAIRRIKPIKIIRRAD